jgi:hypothetical protein
MTKITMICSTCDKDLSSCNEWKQRSADGQDLQLWATDGHVVRFDWQATPQVAACPKSQS